MTKRGLQRLAKAVRDRRAHLGLAQGELAGRGGPSIVTVGQIERAQITRPQAVTLARLDRSLAWTAGSAARVLAGGIPEEIDDGPTEKPTTLPEVADLADAAEETVALIAAVQAHPTLHPAARAHLINQIQILSQLPADARLDIGEQARRRQEAATDAEIDARLEKSAEPARGTKPTRRVRSVGPRP